MLSVNGTEVALVWKQKGRAFEANVSTLPSGLYMINAKGQVARFVKP